MNFKFWKRSKEAEPQQPYNYDELMPTPSGGLLTGLFNGGGNPTQLSSVFSAVELISNSIAELPIYVKTKKQGKAEIIEDHRVYDVFNNSDLPKFMLIKNLIVDTLLHGNGIAYIERNPKGEPVKLWYCPHGTYTIHKTNKLIGTSKVIYHINILHKSKNVEACDVIHIYKNTLDGYTGKSVLSYATDSVKLANYAEKSATNFYKSGCHIGGILTTTNATKLSAKTRNDIREAWEAAHGGADGSNLAILEGGLQFQSVTSSSKDSQLLETRLFNLNEIARFFTINPTLIGDLSKSSYSTLESANMEFTTHTLMPFITLIQEELKRKLLMPNEKNLYIDLDETYLIKADKSSTASYLSTLVSSGIITVNEARRQLGYNDIEGGDNNIIAYTKIDDNIINEADKQDDKNSEEF